ncbi:allophanate hydrolase [Enterococcus sp. AZ103]|uniref:allophanate hydrolase n=1 Tax=Enterococcus sp. AZ103 TaxID=2774628 RepID=UPI003F237422
MKKLTIQQLHRGYQTNLFSVEEIVDQILLKAETYRDYNIWIHLLSKKEIMDYVEKLKQFSLIEKPLWGIPFAIKDNIDLKNIPTTAACPEFSYIPEKSATVVAQLIEAGAIPIGKTNLDQFATGLVGTRSPHGATKNSLNPELISGGSSSGSAVSVALGQVCFSLGTDTAGSGRVPAALNNIVGYKAGVGHYSTEGVVPACESIDCVSVFANNMADINLVDRQINQQKKIPTLTKPKKILIPDKLEFFGPFAKTYEQAWHKTVTFFKKQENTEIFPMAEIQKVAKSLYEGPFVTERTVAIGEFASKNPQAIVKPLAEILRIAEESEYSSNDLFEGLHFNQKIAKQVKKKLKDSFWLLPTSTGTWHIDEVIKDPITTNSLMGLYTNHCNLLDLSAVALPMPTEGQLPFGITFFATPENEEPLKKYAAQIENASKYIELVVCGLHMRGFPLEKDLRIRGGEFAYETTTTENYRLFQLDTVPCKPALVKSQGIGEKITVEIWRLPQDSLSSFIETIAYPLGIGKVVLENGNEKLGFVCQNLEQTDFLDITEYKSWRNYQKRI